MTDTSAMRATEDMSMKYRHLAAIARIACSAAGSIAVGVSVAACSSDQRDMTSPRPRGKVEITNPTLDPSEYVWTAGQSPRPMGSADDRVCFLTGFNGALATAITTAAARVENGSWFLDGYPWSSPAMTVRARCLSNPMAYTSEYVWSQGHNPVSMEHTDLYSCFLTSVRGEFTGVSERIEVYESNGVWYLGGTSQSSGVHARARCVVAAKPAVQGGWVWSPAQTLLPESDVGCFLVGLNGRFASTAQSVRVFPVSTSWYVSASTNLNSPVLAKAGCI